MEVTKGQATPLLLCAVLFSCSGSTEAVSAEVSRAMFGEEWPLTVDSGLVERVPLRAGGQDLSVCTFKAPDGKVYGLNGTAKSRGFADIRPIWRDHPDPEMAGTKVSIGPLIQFALSLK